VDWAAIFGQQGESIKCQFKMLFENKIDVYTLDQNMFNMKFV
jgi:hypothetical protein